MATAKKTNATATKAAKPSLTYAEATQNRQDAKQIHATAMAAAEAAQAMLGSLRERLTEGDTSVTATDLATAEADVQRTELLAGAAAAAVRRAKATEAPLASAHLAEMLAPIVDPAPLDAALAEAEATIASALSTLADKTRRQHVIVRDAIKVAQEVGLHSDGPVRLGSQGMRPVLKVEGCMVAPASVADTLSTALASGAAGAGWRLASIDLTEAQDQPRTAPATDGDHGDELLGGWQTIESWAAQKQGEA